MIDLSLELKRLGGVSDKQLQCELRNFDLSISDDKFSMAFSSYGLTKWLSAIPVTKLREGAPPMTDRKLNNVRWRSVFIFRAYTVFVYMRSTHLERGLDRVPNSSSLLPFKQFFRSGCQKQNEDTIAQHIRNSLSHGAFELSPDLQTVTFKDRDWIAELSVRDFFDGICEEVLRFYFAAYDAHSRKDQ